MKSFINVLALFLAASCATKVELAADKRFERVKIGQEKYLKPAFFYQKAAFAGSFREGQGRSPASSPQPAVQSSEKSSLGVREAYFLGMWQQKIKMESLLGVASNNHCPAFHHDLLVHKKHFNTDRNVHSLDQNWKEALSGNLLSYPVLALPYSESKDLYTLYQEEQELEKAKVVEAFEKFYQQTASEIKQLCETGMSDGYFIYANLAQYYANDQAFMNSAQALKAILKVPSVANHYVLQSLKKAGAKFAGAGRFEMEMLKKLNASWFQSYLYNVKRLGDDKVSATKSRRGH